MKNLLILFLIFCSTKMYSQAFRVFYDLKYKPNTEDSTKINELQILVFNKEKSSFQKYKTLKSDSLFAKTGNLEADLSVYDLPFIITHKLNENKIDYKTILIDSYQYTENINFNWQLENETLIILNNKCQKATTNYGGRKWTAWFSKDYPFSFGPYKFFGLPGLILKISDDTEDYTWEATGILRQKENDLYEKNYFELQGMKAVSLKKEEFRKIEKNYKTFPLGNVMEHFPNADGAEIKEMKNKEIEISKKYLYYNNEIEVN